MSYRIEVELESPDWISVVARDSAGYVVGDIAVQRYRGTATVVSSIVRKGYRRRGIGTQMYEAAAQAVCDEWNVPLRSANDHARNSYSESFWRKQRRLGRAECVGNSGSKKHPCIHYRLSCPPPATLRNNPSSDDGLEAVRDDLRGLLKEHDSLAATLARRGVRAVYYPGTAEFFFAEPVAPEVVDHLLAGRDFRGDPVSEALDAHYEAMAAWLEGQIGAMRIVLAAKPPRRARSPAKPRPPRTRGMRTKRLHVGTILYHGTPAEPGSFRVPDFFDFAWFSTSRSVAETFADMRQQGPDADELRKWIVTYRVESPVDLVLVEDSEMLSRAIARASGGALEPHDVGHMGPEEMAETICQKWDGWIIPNNYPDGDDILICDPGRFLTQTAWEEAE